MPKRHFTPINLNEVPSDEVFTLKQIIEKLRGIHNLQPNKCIHMDEFVLLTTDLEDLTGVTLKNPDPPKDPIDDVSDEYKAELKELIKLYNLKRNEVKSLARELNKAQYEQLEYEKKIELLRTKAKNTAEQRNNKSALKKFRDYSKKFTESLKGFKRLNNNQKVEVRETLEKVTDEISNTYFYLD